MESQPHFQESSDQVINQLGAHLEEYQPTTGKAAELESAAASGKWTLVSDLLARDDVTKRDIEQCFLLHQLATAPDVTLSLVRDIMKKILKHKVNISLADNNGDTAIMLAARCDNVKMLTELLSRKAELPQDDVKVCSFLQILTENWKQEEKPYLHALVVKQLLDVLKEKALQSRQKDIHNALVKLAVRFHPSLLREMFRTRLQLNSLDSDGMTVLHRVAMFSDDDHVRLVPFLVSRGADVNRQNSSGDTPLHVAAKQNNWTIMKAFLLRRAKTDLLNSEQRSVLHIVAACIERKTLSEIDNLLQLLLRNCKDLSHPDGQGNTALHLAALTGKMTLMERLLQRGARADTVNHEQKTVLHVMSLTTNVVYPDYDRILLLAIRRGLDVHKMDCDRNTAMHLAVKHDNWTLVEYLLKHLDDISQPDSEGFNVLHRYAMSSPSSYDEDVLHQLCEKTGDINKKSHKGDGAVHLAARSQKWHIVEILVEAGAMTDELDSEGFHILHRLAMGKIRHHLLILETTTNYGTRSSAGDTALHLAAKHDNWSMVEYFVNHGEDVDEKDSEGLTILQRLVMSKAERYSSRFALFCRLLDAGADYTCRDQNGNTVLHLAAKNSHWEMVKYLLQLGESPDTPDSDGCVLLHRAAAADSKESNAQDVLISVLKNNRPLDTRTKFGDTPIHLAAKHERWETVKTLMEHGANVFDTDSENTSVLERIIWSPSSNHCALPALQTAVQKNPIEQHSNIYGTLLYDAANYGKWEIVKCLVSEGVDVHQLNSEGLNLLHVIASGELPNHSFGNVNDLIECLLDKGIALEEKCPDGNTALHLSAKYDNWAVAKCLVQHGADISSPDSEGVSVIQRLVMCQDFQTDQRKLTGLLIKKGVDVDAEDSDGYTALQLAARLGNWDMVRHLLNKGTTAKTLDSKGMSILHRYVTSVTRNGESNALNAIVSSDVNINAPDPHGNTAIHIAAKRKLTAIVRCLLDDGGDFNIKDSDGFTVLQRLAQTPSSSCLSVCQDLVRKGADVNVCSIDGESVLQLALRSNNWPVVDLLLNCGAHFNVQELETLQVLHRIIKCSTKTLAEDNQLALVKLLTTSGLNTSLKDSSGKTPLDLAFTHQKWAIVTHLLECCSNFTHSPSKRGTFFHMIARSDSVGDKVEDITVLLTKCGLDINLPNNVGDTPIHVAANNGNWDVVVTFVEHGANTNIPDRKRYTLVHTFVRSKNNNQWRYNIKSLNLNVFKTMVKYGADINVPGPDGKTALQMAAAKSDWELVGWLIEVGSAYEMSEEEKKSAFHNFHRLAWGDVEENKLKAFINYITNDGSEINTHLQKEYGYSQRQTALDRCVENCKWNLAKALAECGAEVGGTYKNKPLLQFMITRYSSDDRTAWGSFLDMLISRGLDINVNLENGSGVLFADQTMSSLTCEENDESSLFETLLAKGANPLLVDSRGQSLLRKVIECGGQRTVNGLKRLLSAGVTTHQPRLTETAIQQQTVSTSASYTDSPTEKAIQDRNIKVLKILITSGASSNAELYRLNTDYQVKLCGREDVDPLVTELLDVLNTTTSQPRSLQSLCRLTVSHVLGCGPDRQDRIKRLPVPAKITDFISFRDILFSEDLLEKREEDMSDSTEYGYKIYDSESDYIDDYTSDSYCYQSDQSDDYGSVWHIGF